VHLIKKRNSIGIEISKDFVELYNKRSDNFALFNEKRYDPKMINDNCNNLKKYIKKEKVQLTITSPPYWNILNQKRTADLKKIRNYGNEKKDISNIEKYEDFLLELKKIFEKVYDVTIQDGYCIIVVMDLRKGSKYFPFHSDIMNFMKQIGFELDDIIIWDRKHEYNNLRPLGFPYVFRINKVHEYVLIFKKNGT